MKNEFSDVMSKRLDSELIAIVTTDRSKYQPLAIEAAEAEISKREINTEKFESIIKKNEVEAKKEQEFDSKNVSSGIRLVHFIIDFLAFFAILCIVSLFFMAMNIDLEYYQAVVLMFGIYFGYYMILETTRQKTLGKMITKTRVVNFDGEVPTSQDIFVRTVCRFIPFDRLSFVFVKHGFHDGISKTTVIKDDNF